jgi:pimeloyl-ACP methyl ester carboxylesterase
VSATRLPLGGGASLAVRFDRPAAPAAAGWCFLYLHGFGSRQSGEKANHFRARALAAGLPFCSFDFRGHGESDGELGATTLARNLEDIDRVRRHLEGQGWPRIVLVGSSMGGATALLHAVERPAEVVACLLIAPAVGLTRELENLAQSDRLDAWRRDGAMRFHTEAVETDLDWAFAEDLAARDFRAVARALATPTLVLQGRNDRSVDYRDVLDFVAATPPGTTDLVLYGDGDHRLTDRMDELWARMLEFLRRRGLVDATPAGSEVEVEKEVREVGVREEEEEQSSS